MGLIGVVEGGQHPMMAPSQILKHRIFTPLYNSSVNHEWFSPEQWLNRNDRMRNHDCDLVWCAARVGQIDDDEAGQVGKCADCFRQITAGWLVKVKQNRDVSVCAQGFSEGIEDGLALRDEATKNEDSFSGNGIDHVTNFRVVQQQVNELGDLKIIDGDGWFLFRCDDRVVLYCSLYLYLPDRYAIHLTIGQSGSF